MTKKKTKSPSRKSTGLSKFAIVQMAGRVAELERREVLHRNTLNALRKEADYAITTNQTTKVTQGAQVIAMEKLTKRVDSLEEGTGPLWKTATGTVLRMREMEDSHLSNAIKFLEKQVVKRDLDKKLDNAEWTAKWVPKLNELRDERTRREKQKQESAKWRHLHNGTGPYAMDTETSELAPGRYTMCPSKFMLHMKPDMGVDAFKQALGRLQRIEKDVPLTDAAGEAERITLSDGMTIEPTTIGERTLRKLQKAAEARDSDGNLAYWKRSAEARLDTVLRLRSTIKVLQHEVRTFKANANQRADLALAKVVLKDLTRWAACPLPKGWIPSSRAGRIEAGLKRLADLLK